MRLVPVVLGHVCDADVNQRAAHMMVVERYKVKANLGRLVFPPTPLAFAPFTIYPAVSRGFD